MRLIAALAVVCAAAYAQVSVDESATRAKLVGHATVVSLALNNALSGSVETRIDLEWLDTKGTVQRRAHSNYKAPPGKSSAVIPLPLSSQSDGLFLRLHYSVAPAASDLTAFYPVQGMVGLAQIAEHAFRLTAIGVGTPRAGVPFEFQVLAANPVTGRPVAGVDVTYRKISAKSDAAGSAVLRIVPEADDWEAPDTIDIEGRLGDFRQTVEARHPALPTGATRIFTDKPLYQQGQTLHMRMLATGADSRPRAARPYVIRVRDEHATVLQRVDVTTSRFGIANTDWDIPANTPSGSYLIEVDDEEADRVTQQIEVRRYELPSFRVAVKPDRTFYLPTEKAVIEVSADYLFGKPLTGGTVRIQLEGEDDAASQGVLDAAGHFRATLDPGVTAKDLDGRRYIDQHFLALVTDDGTKRTEQRRFDLRVSREPIHIYLMEQDLPRLYLATYAADGTPQPCDVETLFDGKPGPVLRTNRYGLARIAPSPGAMRLVAVARSPGSFASEGFDLPGRTEPSVRLETDHSLYRKGQPIRCMLHSSSQNLWGTVFAWGEQGSVVYSRNIQIVGGHAEVTIPYDARFGRAASVGFVSPSGGDSLAARSVLYPGPDELTLSVLPGKQTYRPGERASLSLHATDRAGSPVEAALGIAVVDESVLDRAATDQSLRQPTWLDRFPNGETRIGGLSARDLPGMDPAKIDASLELVAEALLPNAPLNSQRTSFAVEQQNAYSKAAGAGVSGVVSQLDNRYHASMDYPRDADELQRMVGYQLGSDDPWMRPYRAEFSREGRYDVLRLISSGPDKKFGTEDDLVAAEVRREWFFPYEALIRQVLAKSVDYPATVGEFTRTLAAAGIRFEDLRDPEGNSLRASITHHVDKRVIEIESTGGFSVATFQGTYFSGTKAKIEAVLASAGRFPANEAQFRAALTAKGLTLVGDRDPWGHAYFLSFHSDPAFGNRVQLYSYAEYQGLAELRRKVTPAKYTLLTIEIRSDGEDGVRHTYDDLAVATFSQVVGEDEPAPEENAPAAKLPSAKLGRTGSISGVVTDASGAVVPRVRVLMNQVYPTETDMAGRYWFRGVPAGTYTLHFQSPGFQLTEIGKVPVRAEHVTAVDTVLQVGSTSESVTVTAEAATINIDSAMVAQEQPVAATSTPHVRDYFPETLLWNPELITDAAGRASLEFTMPDSITTWRVGVMGSTVNGQVSEATAELKSFQPFFVDLDPPPVLTVGDRVALPVPVRNYLAAEQNLSLAVAAPPALAIESVSHPAGSIAAASSMNAIAALHAVLPADAAKLRVTAKAVAAADAIEKPIAIHPDGQLISRSASDLLADGGSLRIETPVDVIAGSLRGEVKFYPTLMAHVMESMESMLRRPNGCAEQTISSSYPNLLFLESLKKTGLQEAKLEARAMRNLRSGYQRLLGYRTEAGAFSYWAGGKADVAVTAYASQFLEESAGIIAVDEAVLESARGWLQKQKPEDPGARSVALRAMARGGAQFQGTLTDGLGELARSATLDDAYAIATFALAAMEAGKPELAAGPIERLQSMAHQDQGLAWWHTPRNTPYYGWGIAGRIETTALAVCALSRWRKTAPNRNRLDFLIDGGVLYLIRNQDFDGLWHSTQATVRVFEALLEAMADAAAQKSLTFDVMVNGAAAGQVRIPVGRMVGGPVTLDVSKFLQTGAVNEVSLRAAGGRAATQAQFTASWYEPWRGGVPSRDVAMQVRYSAKEAAVGEPVRCEVTASRPAFQGYGMMIAEIGLPPGADVDRGTLADLVEHAVIDSFEVAPDRVVLYLWPRAADSEFGFTFRPRFAMQVQTAASALYDYYNPEARAVIAPVSMVVR